MKPQIDEIIKTFIADQDGKLTESVSGEKPAAVANGLISTAGYQALTNFWQKNWQVIQSKTAGQPPAPQHTAMEIIRLSKKHKKELTEISGGDEKTPAKKIGWNYTRKFGFGLAAAAGLAALFVLPWQQLLPPVSKTLPGWQTGTTIESSGTIFIRGASKVEIFNGKLTVTESLQTNPPKLEILAENLHANFKLGDPVDLSLKHPLLTLQVKGTEFEVKLHKSGGEIKLKSGKVKIHHHFTGNEFLLNKPGITMIKTKEIRVKTAEPPKKKKQMPKEVFFMKSGATVTGTFHKRAGGILFIREEGGTMVEINDDEIIYRKKLSDLEK